MTEISVHSGPKCLFLVAATPTASALRELVPRLIHRANVYDAFIVCRLQGGRGDEVQMLQARGLTRALRGSAEIIDRVGLGVCADGTHGVPEAEYQRLVSVNLREPVP